MSTTVGARSSPPAGESATNPNSAPQDTRHPDVEMTTPKIEPSDDLPSPPSRRDEAQPKHSLHHILTADAPTSQPRSQSQATSTKSPLQETPSKPLVWVEGPTENVETDASIQNDSYTRAAEFNPSHTMTVAHTRRNANGTIGSVYSGNKIRHLKKDDGVPLWRKDIQLRFLRCVFDDETPVFTKAFDGTKGHTFADIYIDAMARSSKTSKVLKEKLLADKAGAMTMAMICLLVNVGRMNTTLNFFPEMRAQLRTYHAIPSLQAHADPNAYKQLQDAPRLKSILKGASEDASQPSTIDKIKQAAIPRTNPVNLIFVLSQYAPKISETHFFPPRDFFDLVMRSTLSSKSRANAFLWLVWWYLESDFSEKDALNNPYGAGQHGDGTDGMPIKVPAFEHLTEEQADAENVDTEKEIAWGEMKKDDRRRILEEDETVGPPLKKQRRNCLPTLPSTLPSGKPSFAWPPTFKKASEVSEAGISAMLSTEFNAYLTPANGEVHLPVSDADPTRSPSPSSTTQARASMSFAHNEPALNGLLPEPSPANASRYQPLQSKASPQRPSLKTSVSNPSGFIPGSSPPAPLTSGHPAPSAGGAYRRMRPETSHQRAVNKSRRMRTDHILHKQMVNAQKFARRQKRHLKSSVGMIAYERILDVPDMYDTEDERSWGPAGLVLNPGRESEDYGEESIRHKKVVDRALRRLDRADNGANTNGAKGGTVNTYPWFNPKRKRKDWGYDDENDESARPSAGKGRRDENGVLEETNEEGQRKQEGLDDLDLDLLGEGRSDDGSQDDSDGSDGDETEDEA